MRGGGMVALDLVVHVVFTAAMCVLLRTRFLRRAVEVLPTSASVRRLCVLLRRHCHDEVGARQVAADFQAYKAARRNSSRAARSAKSTNNKSSTGGSEGETSTPGKNNPQSRGGNGKGRNKEKGRRQGSRSKKQASGKAQGKGKNQGKGKRSR